jgi:hypothetical protein
MSENPEIPQADEPPQVAAMRRAARGMSATSDLASKLLCSYVQGGGTWAGLSPAHVEKAFQIANTFMQVAENQWAETMHQVQAEFSPQPTVVESPEGTLAGGVGHLTGEKEPTPVISVVPDPLIAPEEPMP